MLSELWQRFNIEKKLEAAGLLNTQKEPNVDGRTVGKRGSQRDGSGRQRRIKPATIWLRRRLLQRRALNRYIRRPRAAGYAIYRHDCCQRRARPQVSNARGRRESGQVYDAEAKAGHIATGIVCDRPPDVESTESGVVRRIAGEVTNSVGWRSNADTRIE